MIDQAAPSRAHGKAAAIFVFVTVTLDVMAMGMASPVWPQLIRGLVDHGTRSPSDASRLCHHSAWRRRNN